VRAKEARVQPNAGNPLANQPGALPRRDRSVTITTAAEEELARLLACGSDVTVDRLSCLLRHLELDGLAGLLLADGRTIDSVTMRSKVLHFQADNVTASELAIDGEIEHGQVARSPRDLQLGANRPDVLRPERRLGADQFALVPGFATRGLRVSICRVLHRGAPLLQRAIRMRSSIVEVLDERQLLDLSGCRKYLAVVWCVAG
jgi:hypothetical protein